MSKVLFTLGIGMANANQEEIIDVDFSECKTDGEREELMEEIWQNWMSNYLDGGYTVIDDE